MRARACGRSALVLVAAHFQERARARVWTQQLPAQRWDGVGRTVTVTVTVTVGHAPPGGAQGHPVEHRLFGPISLPWVRAPWRPWATLLGSIRSSTTTTGWHVRAVLLAGASPTGERVSDEALDRLTLARQAVSPAGHYPLRPRAGAAAADPNPPSRREVMA